MSGTVRNIAEFLGKKLSDSDVSKIAEHCSWQNMRNNKMTTMDYQRKLRSVDDNAGGFINKGKPQCSFVKFEMLYVLSGPTRLPILAQLDDVVHEFQTQTCRNSQTQRLLLSELQNDHTSRMVLGSFQCWGVLLLLHIVGQGPAVLAAVAGRVGYIFLYFSSVFPF